MLDPLDRHSRDSTLFQFTNKHLRDFIDPKHLLVQIDERFDFQKLVERLKTTTAATTADRRFTLRFWSGRRSSLLSITSLRSDDCVLQSQRISRFDGSAF